MGSAAQVPLTLRTIEKPSYAEHPAGSGFASENAPHERSERARSEPWHLAGWVDPMSLTIWATTRGDAFTTPAELACTPGLLASSSTPTSALTAPNRINPESIMWASPLVMASEALPRAEHRLAALLAK